MRVPAGLAAVALLSATETVAAPKAPPNSESPILAFYPPAALAHRVSGSVILRCGRTRHGALVNCLVVRESPSGEGFGDAAIALAARAARCSRVTLPHDRRITFINVEFSASAQTITPNLLGPGWPIVQGKWLLRPTGEEWSDAYPSRATLDHQGGEATLVCASDPAGRIHDCKVADEDPTGYDFGEASLRLAPYFKIAPSFDCAGKAVAATIVIPIVWVFPSN